MVGALAFLAAAFLLNGAANILLKTAAERGFARGSLVQIVAGNLPLWAGFALFAANALCYFLALRTLPVSVAYPVLVGMTFIIVGTYGALVLREPFGWAQAVAYALILGGVVVAVAKGSS